MRFLQVLSQPPPPLNTSTANHHVAVRAAITSWPQTIDGTPHADQMHSL
jgi:hypothetical protein